jgi:polyferredoxin
MLLGFTGAMFFLMMYSGNVHKWRNLFFMVYAVFFTITFIWDLLESRGHIWLLDTDVLSQGAPMCHIVVPMLLLPLAAGKGIIFPTELATAVFMGLVVLVSTLVFGRGFCSWICFYGGQETLVSSLPRKRRWPLSKPHPIARHFPFGMLFFIVLTSFATLSPIYCIWFCPFKSTTEFFEVNTTLRVIQTFLFFALWLLLVVIMPFLTKKRTQCSFFCPMGAFFSLGNFVSPFKMKIDKKKCTGCKKCISACPTFSLNDETLEKGKMRITCTKCGACVSACSQGAIGFGMRGVSFTAANHPLLLDRPRVGFFRKLAADLFEPGTIFIFGIFSTGTVMASQFFVFPFSRLLQMLGV